MHTINKQVWKGGAGDGVASLVVFGGETIGRTGQAIYMNDVWLYTPHIGQWREVRCGPTISPKKSASLYCEKFRTWYLALLAKLSVKHSFGQTHGWRILYKKKILKNVEISSLDVEVSSFRHIVAKALWLPIPSAYPYR